MANIGGVFLCWRGHYYLFWATFIVSLDSCCVQRYGIGDDSDLVCSDRYLTNTPCSGYYLCAYVTNRCSRHHVGLLQG